LREECRLRVFENGVLRKICQPKRKEVTEGWKKLCNEEIHGLYFALYIFEVIEKMRLAGHVACMVERWGRFRVVVVKPEGKRPHAKLLHRWECNVKIDLKDMGWEGMEWINLVKDVDEWQAVVKTVMDPWVP
jgi:hypothetical protein